MTIDNNAIHNACGSCIVHSQMSWTGHGRRRQRPNEAVGGDGVNKRPDPWECERVLF
jgi:hypothetical protein